MKEINVIELFAGVGGFRVGLERANEEMQKKIFNVCWSNQFEPSTKIQHASDVYVLRYGRENHVNEDIAKVKSTSIPAHDMLVGGFPCQDYSVARTLSQSDGIEGKKGVLWWEICRIIEDKGKDKPKVLFLENVDRLLISPAKQRGRDFAIILASLADLGYMVEWRVINAADYGMPQRRRRTYILAYLKDSVIGNQITNPDEWIFSEGVFAKAFPIADNETVKLEKNYIYENPDDTLADISHDFNEKNKLRPFENAGIMIDKAYWTIKSVPKYFGEYTLLRDILVKGEDRKYITSEFEISKDELPKWEYLKGSKREERKRKDGGVFFYAEGSMVFPDSLDKPSRTIITSEGGKTASRFKHVIEETPGTLRRLIPLELERLNMFPDNHTLGANDVKRAFFMGNALVCGIVTKVGVEIANRLK